MTLWEKISLAWKTAWEGIKVPWKKCWEAFKEALISFCVMVGKVCLGFFTLIWNTLEASIKTIGILCFDWLIEWIRRW